MRRPRLELPGLPLHVTQRGVNRAATFLDDDDRAGYLQALQAAAPANAVAIQGYVLMSNHLHLLVTGVAPNAVSRMMQSVGRRYVRGFNAKYGRTGCLWEGRYKSCLVDSDRYLLACLRYIELNPVRAGMAAWPWEYRWSSVQVHMGSRRDPCVLPHAAYLCLGSDAGSRAAAYRALLIEPLLVRELMSIRAHLQQERALGSPRFQAMVAKPLNHPVEIRAPGRPRGRRADSSANVL